MSVKRLMKIINEYIVNRRFNVKKKYQYKSLKENMEKTGYYEGSDEEFKEKVLPYWEKYGITPKKEYFQYYGYLTQEFNPRFIPDDLYYADMYRFLNDIRYDEFLENKIYLKYLYHDLKQPRMITKYVNGFFINPNDEIIAKEEALDAILSEKNVLIKPSDSWKGIGVKKVDTSNKDEVLKIINDYMKNGDFIIQEILIQSNQMNSFNPSSVNTIRVITLLVNNKVEILSAIVRIGKKDSFVDNYAQGGKVRPIDVETGMLRTFELQDEKAIYKDENGNDLKSELLVSFDKVKEIVKHHSRLPSLRILGWDFAIDENNEPVVIEINAYVGDNQREDGPAYGKFTDTLLEEYVKYRDKKK